MARANNRKDGAMSATQQQPTQTITLPEYPCDICGQHVEAGEKFFVSDGGMTVEHADCVHGWFRGNFGRESL
jgi:hypothetical protein